MEEEEEEEEDYDDDHDDDDDDDDIDDDINQDEEEDKQQKIKISKTSPKKRSFATILENALSYSKLD